MRYAFLAFLLITLLITTADAGYCKMQIKIKLPIEVKLQPLPRSGSQESPARFSPWENNKEGGITQKSPSLQPVHWKGEEPVQQVPAPVTRKEKSDSELTFSPLPLSADTGEQQKDENSAPPANRYDFSRLVQSGNPLLPARAENNETHMLVSRLNEDLFNRYRNSIKEMINAKGVSLPEDDKDLNDAEAAAPTVYKGFKMTRKAALHFKKLEECIAAYFPGRQVIITSTTGGVHLDPRHAEGKAIDFVIEGLTRKESVFVESLAQQAGFTTFNEYIYSSPYKTGDHMHIDLR
jgi:hypothetical protein